MWNIYEVVHTFLFPTELFHSFMHSFMHSFIHCIDPFSGMEAYVHRMMRCANTFVLVVYFNILILIVSKVGHTHNCRIDAFSLHMNSSYVLDWDDVAVKELEAGGSCFPLALMDGDCATSSVRRGHDEKRRGSVSPDGYWVFPEMFMTSIN